MASLFTYLLFLLAIFFISPAVSLPLKIGFYQKTCPSAEAIVMSTVKAALASDPGIPAALIRLHFHDCFVRLKQNFARKGLSMEEMVTLSGAHSIGDSHCSSFSKRLYSFDKTSTQDPSMDPSYARLLKAKCPRPLNTRTGPDPLVPFDPVTPNRLDNNYYKNLKSSKGLLASDQVLWNSMLTRKFVKENVNHPSAWAAKFAAAMVHMGSIDVLTGKQGEIRRNCRVVN
ncbi:hypothetical protein POUND7_018858 [Theobroma cacao]